MKSLCETGRIGIASGLFISCAGWLCLGAGLAHGASISPDAGDDTRITSMRELRDAGVVRQRYDYSCGSAALATLLSYGLNDVTGEQTLLQALLQHLRADELAALNKNGLSLQDLQRLAQARGHKAAGFRLQSDQLARLSRPVIAFVRPNGYAHFVVLKGVRGGRAYLADPSLGNTRMPLYRFLDMWADARGSGVIFAVERKDGTWPDRYALQLAASAGRPLEAQAAERLIESGKPFASTMLNR